MLSEALVVVEAARELRIVRRGQRVATEHEAGGLARAMGILLEAIERFDSETAESAEAELRPKWAVPPQISDEAPSPSPAPSLSPSHPTLSEDALEDAPDAPPAALTAAPSPRRRSVKPMPIALVAAVAGRSMELLDDGSLNAEENVESFLTALEVLDDKLTFAVSKVGWNPRLRALAGALRNARSGLVLELFENDDAWVRLPASDWANLSLAAAEAALDHELSQPPAPAPGPAREARRHDQEERLEHSPAAPRPPGI